VERTISDGVDVADPREQESLLMLLRKWKPSPGMLGNVYAQYLREQKLKQSDVAGLRSALIERSSGAQKDLLRSVGPLLNTEEFRSRVGPPGGISRQSVNTKKHNGDILAVTFRGRRGDFFPEFQLEGREIRPWVPKLLEALPLRSWALLTFLTRRLEDWNGRSPLEALLAKEPGAEEHLFRDVESYLV
jgi:hypothetical protein